MKKILMRFLGLVLMIIPIYASHFWANTVGWMDVFEGLLFFVGTFGVILIFVLGLNLFTKKIKEI